MEGSGMSSSKQKENISSVKSIPKNVNNTLDKTLSNLSAQLAIARENNDTNAQRNIQMVIDRLSQKREIHSVKEKKRKRDE